MTSTKFETKPLFTRQQLTALLLPLIAEQALSVTIGLASGCRRWARRRCRA